MNKVVIGLLATATSLSVSLFEAKPVSAQTAGPILRPIAQAAKERFKLALLQIPNTIVNDLTHEMDLSILCFVLKDCSKQSPVQRIPEVKQPTGTLTVVPNDEHLDTQFVECMKLLIKVNGTAEEQEVLQSIYRAAEQGHDKAALIIALRQSTGRGMPRDTRAAYVWAKRAEAIAKSKETRDAAAKLSEEIAQEMSSERFAAAKMQFADWVLKRELAGFGRVEPANYKDLIVAQAPGATTPKASRVKKAAPHKAASAAHDERTSPKHRRAHDSSKGGRSISYRGSGVTVRIHISGRLRRLAESWGG